MRVFFVTLWKKENRNKVSTKWRLWRTYSFIILNKVQTSCYLIVKFQNESIWYSTFKHSFSSDNNPPNLVELTDEFKMKVLINSKQSLNNIIYGTEQHNKFYCQIMFFYVHLWSWLGSLFSLSCRIYEASSYFDNVCCFKSLYDVFIVCKRIRSALKVFPISLRVVTPHILTQYADTSAHNIRAASSVILLIYYL